MATSSQGDVTLLLIGRTRNGKSSTGNSILGQNAFESKGTRAPVTVDIKCESSTFDSCTIKVVDGPNFGDSSLASLQDCEETLKTVDEALDLSPNGLSAILIVFKYGVRFTKQEKDAVQTIKSIFGESVVKNHGVIVMTCGDSFDLDAEEDKMTFDGWCREQTGDVQALFEECEYRCALFNNKTKDEEKIRHQRSYLLDLVDKVKSRPYTEHEFKAAESGRIKLLVTSKLPELQASSRKFLDEIHSELDRLNLDGSLSPDSAQRHLQDLKGKVDHHMRGLLEEDKGTGVVTSLLTEVNVLEINIQTRITRMQTPRMTGPVMGPVVLTNDDQREFNVLASLRRAWERLRQRFSNFI